ncbi:MAG: RnfH family protein [Proteobacteria bacterium]|jgi:putative ubiquitin-RnfH superfamily antitoxin RatB of RatAB toxin-antitoxin module|nr:RnfH family protein [Pseudomonadota bacterium]
MRCAFAAAWDAWQGVLGLELPEGATVADALEAARSALRAQSDTARSVAEAAEWQTGLVGIFGEICGRDRRLQDGDRVELYRSLVVDPKAARRARATAIR